MTHLQFIFFFFFLFALHLWCLPQLIYIARSRSDKCEFPVYLFGQKILFRLLKLFEVITATPKPTPTTIEVATAAFFCFLFNTFYYSKRFADTYEECVFFLNFRDEMKYKIGSVLLALICTILRFEYKCMGWLFPINF